MNVVQQVEPRISPQDNDDSIQDTNERADSPVVVPHHAPPLGPMFSTDAGRPLIGHSGAEVLHNKNKKACVY